MDAKQFRAKLVEQGLVEADTEANQGRRYVKTDQRTGLHYVQLGQGTGCTWSGTFQDETEAFEEAARLAQNIAEEDKTKPTLLAFDS